jgi:TetR/AcrR family transcriptional repressor of nem operon
MAKETTKMRILEEGARIIHENGYNHTGIQEILDAAGVPKGSFYFYFKSKEDFGLQLVDFYVNFGVTQLESQLNNKETDPLARLRSFFLMAQDRSKQRGFKGGCPIGNLTQEMADQKDSFRVKLDHAFSRMSSAIAEYLKQAQEMEQLNPSIDVAQMAEFILNSWEGALLRVKAQCSIEPLVAFDTMIFERLLKP